ncbi:hypothetical protein GCM10017674_69220 [Streptomyces gardneri]|uniref:Uncharacterized protein n=1 Tax=Streptomyces gardneri TaxID=66892 RepID=A0A4Y3RL69_9ACTN|nr:hypothetical protein SGA01_37240 [Streptomyces gardneri]GHH17845.1 hypothetical protein GCM10017674_69220 [Streptomyces gardneri]
MPWPVRREPQTGPSAPLLAGGSVLTAAGSVMYLLPQLQSPLCGIGALALAFTAAVAVSARTRR